MAAEEKAGEICSNCRAPITKVCRCSVCKKAAYCSAACQKEDWRFHKRICKKPEEARPGPLEKRPDNGDTAQEMKKHMDELTKGQDPALAKQVQSMMAGMMGMEAPKEPERPPVVPCQNCAKACDKPLRCGVCKTATYCSPQCQKDDWRFHKRLCQKPAPAPAPGAPAEPAAAPAAGAPGAAGPEQKEPARPKESERVVEKEDVGTWYKHREWKPQEERKEFVPAKVEPAREPAAEAAAGGSAASSWNAAGTWEEKNMLPWWQERLQTLQGLEDGEGLQVDKVGPVSGEASIVHVRGQPKFMYDVTCDLAFSGLQRCKPCARSPPGSRCSNCMRVQGRLALADFNWACEGDMSLQVRAEEPPGPSHVKKAGQKECAALAQAKLIPAVRGFLDGSVSEYKALVASGGPKWASQLPPVAATTATPATGSQQE